MSEETKNPLIESFLKMHEATPNFALRNATTTTNAQAGSQYAKSMADTFKPRVAASSNLVGFSASGSSGINQTPQLSGSQNFSYKPAPAPIKPTFSSPQSASAYSGRQMNTAIPRTDPLSTSSGQRVGSGAGTSAFKGMPSGSGSGATSGEGYAERLKGVQKANPIAAPGKLKSGNLQMGSRGEDVLALQNKLKAAGYNIGKAGADGKFGKDTAAALRAYQQKNNLKVDAIYGTQTKSAFDRADAISKLKTENPQGYKQYTGSSLAQNQITNSGVNSLTSSKEKPAPTPSSQSVPPAASTNQNATSDDNSYSSYLNKPVTFGNILGLSKKVGGDLGSAAQSGFNTLKKLQFNSYEPGDHMSNELIEAFLKLHSTNSPDLFAEAKKAKKFDPVGKEDEDIDNDGDSDKSDKYLHNRRKAIARAMKANEEVEQIDELKKSALEKVRNRAAGRMMDDPRDEKAYKVEKQASKRLKKITDAEKEESSKRAYKAYKEDFEEDVEFSEAEIEHITSILEAMPVAPTSDNNTAFGKSASRSGTLTDEVLAKKKIKEDFEELDEEDKKPYTGKKRGRKAGVKVGAYGPRGGGASSGESSGNVSVPHVAHQIRHGKPDSQGNYTLQHHVGNDKKGNPIIHTAKVAAQHAVRFYGDYHGTEKPRDKEAKTDAFISKHFNISKPKATGISLPKMPAPKS